MTARKPRPAGPDGVRWGAAPTRPQGPAGAASITVCPALPPGTEAPCRPVSRSRLLCSRMTSCQQGCLVAAGSTRRSGRGPEAHAPPGGPGSKAGTGGGRAGSGPCAVWGLESGVLARSVAGHPCGHSAVRFLVRASYCCRLVSYSLTGFPERPRIRGRFPAGTIRCCLFSRARRTPGSPVADPPC